MCIIIANKKGSVLDKVTLENSTLYNNDSFGLAYSYEGKFYIYKTLKRNTFINKYYKIREKYPNINVSLHCRISTHGKTNIKNCHPFYVNQNLVFAHNGILQKYTEKASKKISDTRVFCNEILKTLPVNFYTNETTLLLLKSFIGNGNKLRFIDKKGLFYFVNKNEGEMDSHGNWFSNDSHCDYMVYGNWTSYNQNHIQKTNGYNVYNYGYPKNAEVYENKTCVECETTLYGYERSLGYCDNCLRTSTEIKILDKVIKESRMKLAHNEVLLDYIFEIDLFNDIYESSVINQDFASVLTMCNENFIYLQKHIDELKNSFENDVSSLFNDSTDNKQILKLITS